MSYSFTLADVEFLTGSDGIGTLADADRLELSPGSLLRDLGRARQQFGDRSTAVVETVLLRRRSAGKIVGGSNWLYTDDGLQQATPSAVARNRARRLAGRAVHDVTCSIGAELAELVGAATEVLGSDLDPVRLRMAAHNVPGAGLLRADALHPSSRGTVVIADPARRSGGRRTHDPAQLQPPLPDLLDAYRGRDLAVKCAPGLDFDKLEWPGEIEVVSLDGGVKEACLWSSGLSAGIGRRASVLASDGTGWDITDAEPDDVPERAPGEWIVNPDGAVVRAGLVRHYGARHGLWQLDPRIAYLTGDRVPDGVRGFRILEQLKYTEKLVRQELARRDCGSLEILVRGVDVDPATLRPRLKLRGTRRLSLVITRIGRTAVAFVCDARTT
ncbi:THUMP-like domain-containing protein [Antrihabitans cavernicola]|uniref:Class I SAM-dependent methyltransferase n=1 Tax=Antrihabitans cavernicola TaxID=2495913 RepID=A0A5A7SDF0_9NOCA|nr:class I SAM-dependent methyltransferase [Spelaeibacter cavernicola]KAA0024180.1 class I SAM-dependent methyltransferase [Spelaeibacter cavernicola]